MKETVQVRLSFPQVPSYNIWTDMSEVCYINNSAKAGVVIHTRFFLLIYKSIIS